MRHIKLATILVLSVLVIGDLHAQESVRIGNFTISLTKRSPLSAIEAFAKRFGWTKAELDRQHDSKGQKYDTTRVLFEVYVPNDYQPSIPYGLLV